MKKTYSFIIAAAMAAVSCSSPSIADYSAYIDDCVRAELATINYIYDESNGSMEDNAILLGSVLNSLGYPAFAELGSSKVNYSYNLGPSVVKYHQELGMSYGDAISRFLPYTTSPYKYDAAKLYDTYLNLNVKLEDFRQTVKGSKEAEWTFAESSTGVSFIFGVKNPGTKGQELSFKAEESSLEKYIDQLK
ncbi:MAG: hypothetical protein MJY72_02815 [Bacteroidales bacterium]|nr:hypothetical protein [Bacteroidales bacterium]